MKLQSLGHTGVLTILSVMFATCLSGARPAEADEADELKKLQKEVQVIQKAVADPLANELQYFRVRIRLRSLKSRTESMIKKYAKQDDEGHRLHKLHGQIIAELKTVNSRLPEPPIRPVSRGLPVPKFDPDKKLGQLAAELHQAQTALVESLISKSKSKGNDNKLAELILAQEKLAWEAGWPFTRKEEALYRNARGLTAEVYHMRRNRGVERINNQLARDAAKVGREPPRPFVIHHPEDKADREAILKHLTEKHGKAAKAWSKGTRPFDSAERAVLLGTR